MKDKIEIGKIISEARKKKGYTQVQLAKKLNISNKAISHWEKGRYYPDYEYFNDISDILDINLNEYLKKKDTKTKKYLKLIIKTLFIISSIFLLLFFISNYKKITLYEVFSENKNIIIENGYITKTNDYLIINLGEIDNKNYLIEPNYKLTLYYDKNKIISLNNYKNLTYKSPEKELIDNINKLYIKLEYKYLDTEEKTEIIQLNLKEMAGNKQIVPIKVKKSRKNNESQKNLLNNNDYFLKHKEKYIKTTEDSVYEYDILSKRLFYEKKCAEKTIKAVYKQELIEYIVLKNNKIIDKYEKNNKLNKNNKYYSDIYNKLKKEYEKITLEN